MAKLNISFIAIVTIILASCSSEKWDYDPDIIELDGVKAYIAHYYNNKDAAITITLDDGSYGQYTIAAPQLEQRNLPATFFINGSFIKPILYAEDDHMDSLCLLDLSQRGFEVSNHTWSHVNLTTISIDSAKTELARNDDAIERWTGKRPTTMSFPNNARTPELIEMAMKDRVGVRTFEEGFGQTYRHNTYDDMKKWADNTYTNKKWGVAMLHGMDRGYDHWDDLSLLWKFLDYLCDMKENVWFANFHDAVSYVTERDSSTLSLYKSESGDIVALLSSTLNAELYTQPLTLVVEQDGKTQFVDIYPNKSVVLRKDN